MGVLHLWLRSRGSRGGLPEIGCYSHHPLRIVLYSCGTGEGPCQQSVEDITRPSSPYLLVVLQTLLIHLLLLLPLLLAVWRITNVERTDRPDRTESLCALFASLLL